MTGGVPAGRRHQVRELLAVRDFRRLLSVRLIGQCGDGLLQGAMFGAAFFNPNEKSTAAGAALAFAVLLLPYSAVGPFAGVLLDRWSRQRILLVSNLVRGAVVLLLALSLARTGAVSPTTVVLALLAISVNRFVLSGLSAALPRVVVDHHLVTANSFTTTLGTGATTVGAVASLGLRQLWGEEQGAAGAIATVAAVSYLLAAVAAATIGRSRLGPETTPETPSLLHSARELAAGLVDGALHVRAAAPAARALGLITAQRFFSGLLFVIVLLLYTEAGYLGNGIGGLGQAIGAVVVGGLLAAVVTPQASRRLGAQRWIVLCMVAAGLVTALLLPPFEHPLLLAAGVVLGFAAQAVKICVDTLLQESVEDSFRGRVFALYDVLFNVGFVTAAACAAVVVPDDGHSVAVVLVLAAGYLTAAAAYARACARATL